MRNRLFLIVSTLFLLNGWSISAQTYTSVENIATGFDTSSRFIAWGLPFVASAGMDWSDAYIGPLTDTNFPFVHLGVGASAGFANLPYSATANLLQKLDGNESSPSIFLPFAVVNARVGGWGLPFDVGLKVGYLPDQLKKSAAAGFDYQNFGIDLRYNLVRSDFWLPDVSVGAGLNYIKEAFSLNGGLGETFNWGPGGMNADTTYLYVNNPTLNFAMDSTSFELKTQVSKSFLYILTPYMGVSVAAGTAHSQIDLKASISTNSASLADWVPYIGPLSATGMSRSASGFALSGKFYWGTSLNLWLLKLDGQLMSNMFGGTAASISARIQL